MASTEARTYPLTFWERLGFRATPRRLAPHAHYCSEHDRRWPCAVEPCLLHLVAPCPDAAHEGPTP
jgi:hypothetical protein